MSDSLTDLFDPKSVAVVGASNDPKKWGHWLARGALAGAHRRTVHLVNHNGSQVVGTECARRLSDLPEVPELVAITTPPAHVRAVVEEGLALGVRYFVVITTGVGDPPSSQDERALIELVRDSGARLVGPNCMGLVDTTADFSLSWGEFATGAVGLVSQSGNVGLELGRMLARVGQGFSRFVSLGNQHDVDAVDAIEALIAHKPTKLIAAYIEDFRDGRRLAEVFAAATAADKPVLLLTVGRSEASSRAALSHTGALVSASAVVQAMCRESGALYVSSSGELVDTAQVLLAPVSVQGERVAVLGDSGGQSALAADTLSAATLSVPTFDSSTIGRLGSVLPTYAGLSNPVDLAGVGEADLGNYPAVAELLHSSNTDVTVLTGYFGDYATDSPALMDSEVRAATRLAEVSVAAHRPVLVHSMGRDTQALVALRDNGIPVLERIEHLSAALHNAARWHAQAGAIPHDAGPSSTRVDVAPVGSGDYEDMRNLLVECGIDFPPASFVRNADDAIAAARRLGYPVALKAMGLAHKTEMGGVALGLDNDSDLRAAFGVMRQRTGSASYAVESMCSPPHAVELIMGVRRDAAFGPVAMVGIGGTTAELLADTAVGLAPLTHERAEHMIRSLRLAPLLGGWRGAPPADVDAAARTLVRLARAGVEHPELAELEINPVLVHPSGAIALDAAGVIAR